MQNQGKNKFQGHVQYVYLKDNTTCNSRMFYIVISFDYPDVSHHVLIDKYALDTF